MNSIFNTVPVFDGSNYLRWKEKMKSYLQVQNLWLIVNGTETKLPALVASTNVTQDQVDSREAARVKWLRDDEAALGAISLKLRDDFQILIGTTSARTWDAIEAKYGTTTASQIYGWFSELMRWKLNGKEDPFKEFARWDLLVDKLGKAQVTLPDKVLAMLLMSRNPPAYKDVEPVVFNLLHSDKLTTADYKLAITTAWNKRKMQTNNNTKVANRISAIKPKGAPPSFHHQTGSSHRPKHPAPRAGPGDQQQEHKQRGKRAGAKSRKGKGKGKGPAVGDKGVTQVASFQNQPVTAWIEAYDPKQPTPRPFTPADTESQEYALPFEVVPPQPFTRAPAASSAGPSSSSGTSAAASAGPSSIAATASITAPPRKKQRQLMQVQPKKAKQVHKLAVEPPKSDKGKERQHYAPPPHFNHRDYKVSGCRETETRPASGRTAPPFCDEPHLPPVTGRTIYGTDTPIFRQQWPPLGTPGPIVPSPLKQVAWKPQTPNSSPPPESRPTPTKPKATIAEFGKHGSISTRIAPETKPVQGMGEKPSPYPVTVAARKAADQMGIRKSSQVLQNLELEIGKEAGLFESEAMAPRDMAAEVAPERELTPIPEEDCVSLGDDSVASSSRKRSRSQSADPEEPAPSKQVFEFGSLTQADLFAPADTIELTRVEFPIELTEEDLSIMDHLYDDDPLADECRRITYDFLHPPAPAAKFRHKDAQGNPFECDQKAEIYIQPDLDSYDLAPGWGWKFFPCGHGNVQEMKYPILAPLGWCVVHQVEGLWLHYGDIPRIEPRKNYRWIKDGNGVWIQVWKTWVGSITYTDQQYRQDCVEDSILGFD
ncbi:hypothetical protein MD484_g6037, partial [Candolleomyces efflorescens]